MPLDRTRANFCIFSFDSSSSLHFGIFLSVLSYQSQILPVFRLNVSAVSQADQSFHEQRYTLAPCLRSISIDVSSDFYLSLYTSSTTVSQSRAFKRFQNLCARVNTRTRVVQLNDYICALRLRCSTL